VLGLAVGVALGRALLRPREDLSAYLLCAAIAAFASTVPGGQSGNPNGARYAYLTTTTAVAAAAGLLALLALFSLPRRRAAALALVGLVLTLGAVGARDALVRWSRSFDTYWGFHGFDTRIGRAAARWDRFGQVAVESGVGHSPVTIGVVRR
jgi:peptidoglycan/LPS O-acetylase OafA/YrhL